jgi:hypothetical protein
MDSDLVQLITDLVMAELGVPSEVSRPAAGPPSAPAPALTRQVLVCPVAGPAGSLDLFWQALREVPDVGWLLVRVPGADLESARRLLVGKFKEIDPVASWDEVIGRVEAVILPTLTVDLMARLSLLLHDQPAAGAALAGIIQGKPVLAGATELNDIRRSSGRLPGGFLTVFHQYVRTLEGLGVQILEPPALVARLDRSRAATVSSSARGRDVVTVEDLEAAARAGQKRLSLAPGTIVTPLAWDKAREMGIEMSFA